MNWRATIPKWANANIPAKHTMDFLEENFFFEKNVFFHLSHVTISSFFQLRQQKGVFRLDKENQFQYISLFLVGELNTVLHAHYSHFFYLLDRFAADFIDIFLLLKQLPLAQKYSISVINSWFHSKTQENIWKVAFIDTFVSIL